MERNRTNADVFGLLTHETRVRILEAVGRTPGPTPLADLAEELSLDADGKFEYHREKLEPELIYVESGACHLTDAGRRIVAALRSLEYDLFTDEVEAGVSCHSCGGAVTMGIDRSHVRMYCSECELRYANLVLPYAPPEEASIDEILLGINRTMLARQRLADEGICHICWGTMEAETGIIPGEEVRDWYDSDDAGVARRYDCRHCGESWQSVVDLVLLSHPSMDAFHYDHGIDLRETPWWDLEWLGVATPTILSRNPFQMEFTVRLDDEELTMTVDREMSVITKRRTQRSARNPDV